MKKELTCIMCPMGCQLVIDINGKDMKVSGNNCIRGEQYAKSELTEPKRIVTTLVKTANGVLPCKITCAVPKAVVMKVVNKIKKLKLTTAKLGDVIVTNILNTGADVVITGNYVKYDL